MPLRGRVGRHTKLQGRHCQNWSDDQQVVMALLNKISLNEGGASGGLNGRIVAGIAGDPLYSAIVRFEDKHFPGQRSGFVDPGGAMLKRMESLAVGNTGPKMPVPAPPPPTADTALDILRRNLHDETQYNGWAAGDRIAFDPLIAMADKHLDELKRLKLEKLPWKVEMFGRAHVLLRKSPRIDLDGDLVFLDYDKKDETAAPPMPEMRYGAPVDENANVTTMKLGALLLYQDGNCRRVPPYHWGFILGLRKVDKPRPIFGADRNL